MLPPSMNASLNRQVITVSKYGVINPTVSITVKVFQGQTMMTFFVARILASIFVFAFIKKLLSSLLVG
ncbi:TPA: hypothetical protein U2C79_001052 [Streptococcus suis]|nr:hypothetical protein [Streptococcus suis]